MIRFEEFDLVKITRNGFSICNLMLSIKMKNVKPEFEGIRESFHRSIIGIFFTKRHVMVYFMFLAKEIKRIDPSS